MTIVGQLPGGFLISQISQAGPNPYNEGARPTIIFNDFKQSVETILSVEIEAVVGDAGAFIAHAVTPIVGRTLTVMVTGEDAAVADGAPNRELVVGDAVNLANKNIVAVAIGR